MSAPSAPLQDAQDQSTDRTRMIHIARWPDETHGLCGTARGERPVFYGDLRLVECVVCAELADARPEGAS